MIFQVHTRELGHAERDSSPRSADLSDPEAKFGFPIDKGQVVSIIPSRHTKEDNLADELWWKFVEGGEKGPAPIDATDDL